MWDRKMAIVHGWDVVDLEREGDNSAAPLIVADALRDSRVGEFGRRSKRA
jgi:hypothetical protein